MKTIKIMKKTSILAMLCIGLMSCNSEIESLEFEEANLTSKKTKSSESTVNYATAASIVDLGTAGSYTILSKSGITNVSPSLIQGNVGTSPITGAALLLTCAEVDGLIHTVAAAGPGCTPPMASTLTTAVGDMEAAYTAAASLTHSSGDHLNVDAGSLGVGVTLEPGVYTWGSTLLIPSDIILDSDGMSDPKWIFQVAGTLTVSNDVKMTFENNLTTGDLGKAEDVFWQVSGAVTLGTGSHFVGNLLGKTSIAVQTHATVNGRLLAQTAVTLQKNIVWAGSAPPAALVAAATAAVKAAADAAAQAAQASATAAGQAATAAGQAATAAQDAATAAGSATYTVTEAGDAATAAGLAATAAGDAATAAGLAATAAGQAATAAGQAASLPDLPAAVTAADLAATKAKDAQDAAKDAQDAADLAATKADLAAAIQAAADAEGADSAVDLGMAGSFAILSKSGITNVYESTIIGDVGTSPITGAALLLTDGEIVTGTGNIYTVAAAGPAGRLTDADKLATAVLDMQAAYENAAGRTLTPSDVENLGAGTIGGIPTPPLVKGLYTWGSALLISGNIELSGSATDKWIFQVAGTLTVSNGVRITLSGGAKPENIVWQVAGAVTLGTTSHFEGTLLGKTSIAVQTDASVNGRLLAQTAVTLQMNTVTAPN